MSKEKIKRNSYLEKRKQKHEVEEHEEEIIDISKAEQLVENNSKYILFGVVGLVLLAALFIFFNQSSSNKEQKAAAAAIEAQNYFAQQNWQAAIDGEENHLGFKAISEQYGNTQIGNLAHYYTGISYMKTGEFQKAIEALKNYKQTEDPNINGLVFMNLGDAEMELGNNDKALKYYSQAANTNSESFQADFILRYAMALSKANEIEDAKQQFNKLVQQYPNTMQGNTAQQYLAGL